MLGMSRRSAQLHARVGRAAKPGRRVGAGFNETAGRLAVVSGPVATPCSVKAAFPERQASLTLAGSGGAAGVPPGCQLCVTMYQALLQWLDWVGSSSL